MADYTASSGMPIYGGRHATSPRPWAASVPVNTWTEVGEQTFSAWAATGIPGTDLDYNGGGKAKAAIITAFSTPAFSRHFWRALGGGHGDGTCDAVCDFDKSSLTWSLVGLPTPPSKRPPIYVNGGAAQPGVLQYPSGLLANQLGTSGGHFLDAPPLSDPADLPYATRLSRTSTHMYASAVLRGDVLHCFYLAYGEFTGATGSWSSSAAAVRFGEQLVAAFPSYNNLPLQQGTVAIYDDVTDRFFVTLNPGDGGGGWRNRVLVINPTTRAIESILSPGDMGPILNSVSIVRVNRKLYIFLKLGPETARDMNAGMILDMDTKVFQKFIVSGTASRLRFNELSGTQETIPGWYDDKKIRLFNHNVANRGVVLSIAPTPQSGAGSTADPFVLQMTETVVANAPDPIYTYRIDYDRDSGCALILPNATSRVRALKFAE